ncbi:MAG: hypothetical protein K2K25_11100, partial [Muribaculaceae bacterium]|nr:hypothetical protein [Muribaculaceae bacterium]
MGSFGKRRDVVGNPLVMKYIVVAVSVSSTLEISNADLEAKLIQGYSIFLLANNDDDERIKARARIIPKTLIFILFR